MTATIAAYVRFLGRILRSSGPYLFLELLLPGGTLFALLLFYYRRRQGAGTLPPWSRRLERSLGNFYRDLERTLDPAVSSAWHGNPGNDGLEALAMVPVK